MAHSEMREWEREVARLEELAAIRLNEQERRRLVADLKRIVSYVRRVSETAGEGADVVDWPVPLLEDTPREGLKHEAVFANAPRSFCDMFVVPPIIEERR